MNDMPLFFTYIEVVMTINLFQEKTEKITSTKELANYILDSVNNSSDEMSEEKRKDMDARIQAKLESRKKLTPEELRYMQKYNPMLYAHALRVQVLAKAVEEQLSMPEVRKKPIVLLPVRLPEYQRMILTENIWVIGPNTKRHYEYMVVAL